MGRSPLRDTTIVGGAFAYCDALTSVTIGDSLTSIGYAAFASCTSLTSINVAAANPNFASLDGVLFNKDLTTLIQAPGAIAETYIIPDSVTTIDRSAFENCDALTNVTIPDSVTTIGPWAFAFCDALTSVTIGDSLTTIDVWAFYHCDALTSVTIPDSVTSIGAKAFALTSIQYDHDDNALGLRYLLNDSGTAAFLVDASAASGAVNIPDQVQGARVLSINAFSDNSTVTSVTIPDSVTTIGFWAFYNCDALTSVTIPDSVSTIGDYAFYHCTSLTSVTFEGNAPDSFGSGLFETDSLHGSTIPIPGLTLYYYEGTTGFTTPTWQGYPTEMLPAPIGANDLDGDGWPDDLEALLGTDQSDPGSHFRVWLGSEGGNTRLHYGPHSDAVSFTVRGTSDLTLPRSQWPVVEGLDFIGDSTQQTAELPTAGAEAMFYIIEVTENE